MPPNIIYYQQISLSGGNITAIYKRAHTDTAGGERGIRTPGKLTPTIDFESIAFNRTRPSLLIVLCII